MRSTTSARAGAGRVMPMSPTSPETVPESRRLAALVLFFRSTVNTLVIEREVPPVDHDSVAAAAFLHQRGEPAVGPLLAQAGADAVLHLLQGGDLGGQALQDLEEV